MRHEHLCDNLYSGEDSDLRILSHLSSFLLFHDFDTPIATFLFLSKVHDFLTDIDFSFF